MNSDQQATEWRRQLGLIFQRRRAERGWSRLELVSHSGVASATIQAIEAGERSPRLETLVRLCSALSPEHAGVALLRDVLAELEDLPC